MCHKMLTQPVLFSIDVVAKKVPESAFRGQPSFFSIDVMAKRVTLSQHFVTHVVSPLGYHKHIKKVKMQ